jgi:hypothetical protein
MPKTNEDTATMQREIESLRAILMSTPEVRAQLARDKSEREQAARDEAAAAKERERAAEREREQAPLRAASEAKRQARRAALDADDPIAAVSALSAEDRHTLLARDMTNEELAELLLDADDATIAQWQTERTNEELEAFEATLIKPACPKCAHCRAALNGVERPRLWSAGDKWRLYMTSHVLPERVRIAPTSTAKTWERITPETQRSLSAEVVTTRSHRTEPCTIDTHGGIVAMARWVRELEAEGKITVEALTFEANRLIEVDAWNHLLHYGQALPTYPRLVRAKKTKGAQCETTSS